MKALLVIAGSNELQAVLASQSNSVPPSILQHWHYYSIGKTWVLYSGMGAINAACAVQSFCQSFQVSRMLQLGLSGAHRSDLPVGSIVVGESVVNFSRHIKQADGSIKPLRHFIQNRGAIEEVLKFETPPEVLAETETLLKKAHIPYQLGTIGGADQFNRNPDFINAIHDAFGTDCEDMESAAVANVSRRFRIPYQGIRVISNNELSPTERTNDGDSFDPRVFETLQTLASTIMW